MKRFLLITMFTFLSMSSFAKKIVVKAPHDKPTFFAYELVIGKIVETDCNSHWFEGSLKKTNRNEFKFSNYKLYSTKMFCPDHIKKEYIVGASILLSYEEFPVTIDLPDTFEVWYKVFNNTSEPTPLNESTPTFKIGNSEAQLINVFYRLKDDLKFKAFLELLKLKMGTTYVWEKTNVKTIQSFTNIEFRLDSGKGYRIEIDDYHKYERKSYQTIYTTDYRLYYKDQLIHENTSKVYLIE